jgi:hypothetical protein
MWRTAVSEPARFIRSILNTTHCSARFFLALHSPINFYRNMEDNISPSVLVKRLESDINLILRKIALHKLDEKERNALAKLRQALNDAKVYGQDYELSEMRDEQLDNAKQAKKYLEQARQAILKASESNIFSAIDVAHLSANIDQLIGDLK